MWNPPQVEQCYHDDLATRHGSILAAASVMLALRKESVEFSEEEFEVRASCKCVQDDDPPTHQLHFGASQVGLSFLMIHVIVPLLSLPTGPSSDGSRD